MADPLTTVITVLSKTDGRDKIYKTLAGVLCYYAHVMNVRFPKSRSAQSALEMAKSITSGRSLMRLGKWMENIRKLIIALQTSQSSGLFLCAEEFLEFMRVLFDMIYVLGDNIAFFRRHEFLYTIFPTLDMILRQARIFQFWAFLYAVMLDTVRLYKGISLCGAKEGRSGNVRDLQLNLIKNTADLLVSLNMVGYASKLYRPTAKTTALLAVLSGSIATYQNVRKVMPSQRFLKSYPRDDEEKPTSLTMLR